MVPVAVPALVTTGAEGSAALTVKVKVLVPVPPAFVALKVMLDVPAAVGVPEIKPVPVSRDRPVPVKPVAP